MREHCSISSGNVNESTGNVATIWILENDPNHTLEVSR